MGKQYYNPEGYTVNCIMVQPDEDEGVWNLVVQMDNQKESKRSQIFYTPSFPSIEPSIIFDVHSWLGTFWASPSKIIYATDSNGKIWTNRSGKFECMNISEKHIINIWGVSDESIFVVGEKGLVLYFDGSSWHDLSIDTENTIYGINGITENLVYVVGNNGFFKKLVDIKKWETIEVPEKVKLRKVLSTEESVYVCGEKGTIFHYQNNKIKPFKIHNKEYNYSGIGFLKNELYFGAGHFGVDILSDETVTIFKKTALAYRMSYSEKYLWTCGNNSIYRFDGKGWLKKDWL